MMKTYRNVLPHGCTALLAVCVSRMYVCECMCEADVKGGDAPQYFVCVYVLAYMRMCTCAKFAFVYLRTLLYAYVCGVCVG